MIYIDRNNTAIPESLNYKNSKSKQALYTRKKVAALAEHYQGKVSQQIEVDDSCAFLLEDSDFKHAISSLFNEKCAICETRLKDLNAYIVRRFRPTNNAMNSDGKVSRASYWWLAYEWSNLYLICGDCSNSQGNRFPVDGRRAVPNHPIAKENSLIIDPCDKADFSIPPFIFRADGSIYGRNRKAMITIDVFNLNRYALKKDRREAMNDVKIHSEALSKPSLSKQKLAEHTKALKLLFGSDKPYLAAKAAMVRLVENKAESRLVKKKIESKEEEIIITESTREVGERGMPSASAYKKRSLPKGRAKRSTAAKKSYKKTTAKKATAKKATAKRATAKKEKFKKRASRIILAKNKQIRESLPEYYFAQNAPAEFVQTEMVEPIYQQTAYRNINFESTAEKESYFSSVKKVSKIEINNFKIIKSLTLDFPSTQDANEPWLVLLGENGSGKSSVLQALAFTLMGSKKVNQLGRDASAYVNRNTGAASGFVKVHLTGIDEPVELTFSKKSKRFESNYEDPIVLMQAFGSTRLMSKRDEEVAYDSLSNVKNLFDHYYALPNIENWLGDRSLVNKVLFDEIATELKKLLLLPPERDITRRKVKKGEFGLFLKLHADRKEERLLDLSAGYQAVIILSVTIMREMLKVWDHFKLAEGIVLIDEIGVHMHPRWKLQIVNNLRSIFPNLTFVVTTHEPLCLRGVKKGEVMKMRADEKDNVIALPIPISPDSLTIDQMMTSNLFGLLTSFAPDVELKMNTYYFLKAKGKLNTKEKKQFKQLEKELTELKVIGGHTLLEKTEEIVKETFVQEVYSGSHDSSKVNAKVKKRLAGMLKRK